MRRVTAYALLGIIIFVSSHADARGIGRFLSSLVARGAISSAAHSAATANAATTYALPSKSYTPDVLTVDQLVGCLKRAAALDKVSELLEVKRVAIQWASKDLDDLGSRIESAKSTINRRDQFQIDRINAQIDAYNAKAEQQKASSAEFNRLVDSHNTDATSFNSDCAKKYYADDMAAARKLAGL